MRHALIAALAVALPVAGTLYGIAGNELALRDATTWRIPVDGYDPRDPLRGRYIAFRYVWAARGDVALCRRSTCGLCLEDGGRRVRVVAEAAACAARVDPVASGLTIATEPGGVSARARLWVSEDSAPVLERQLADRPMMAVARLTTGGRLVADRLEPAR